MYLERMCCAKFVGICRPLERALGGGDGEELSVAGWISIRKVDFCFSEFNFVDEEWDPSTINGRSQCRGPRQLGDSLRNIKQATAVTWLSPPSTKNLPQCTGTGVLNFQSIFDVLDGTLLNKRYCVHAR
jgi:hypothetical protein